MSLLRRRAILASAATMLAMPHVARAAPRVIRLGHNSSAAGQYGQGCLAMAAAAASHPDLQRTVTIEVHGNGEFGDELAMVADCRAGTIDMIASISSAAGEFCPEIGILDVPFVFSDIARGRAAFDGATGEEFAGLLAEKGLPLMGWLENGLRHMTSNRPVRGPADLAGLKLRLPQSRVAMDSFRALGADARPLAFNLLHAALETGQFEAQENPIAAIETIKLAEVQRFLCLTGHTYSVGMICASPDLVDDLTARQLAALRECARHGTARSREVAAAADADGVGRLRQAGMVVIDDVDKAAFARAARPNLQRLSDTFGPERVQRLIRAAS